MVGTPFPPQRDSSFKWFNRDLSNVLLLILKEKELFSTPTLSNIDQLENGKSSRSSNKGSIDSIVAVALQASFNAIKKSSLVGVVIAAKLQKSMIDILCELACRFCSACFTAVFIILCAVMESLLILNLWITITGILGINGRRGSIELHAIACSTIACNVVSWGYKKRAHEISKSVR